MKVQAMTWLLVASLTLTGCATMYDAMGLVAKETLVERDKKLSDLEAQVAALSEQVKSADEAAQRVASIEALIRELETKVDQIPQVTLRRLIAALTRAAEEASAAKP